MAARHAKVIIVGAGPAGYTAAIYAARAMLEPVLIEGIQPGGQMTITTDVENYPGFADVIQGPWLMEQMRLQAEHVGTELIADTITEVDLKRTPFWLKGDSGAEYTADSLIIATCAKALEATGGAGYLRPTGIEKLLRDAYAAQFHPMQERKQQEFSGRMALGLDPIG